MADRLSFKSLTRVRKGKDDLTIVGGTIAEASLMTWLTKWSDYDLPWRLWEWSHELHLEHESQKRAFPAEIKALERGRLFGAGGDLTVRRDGELFRWHFIGRVPKTEGHAPKTEGHAPKTEGHAPKTEVPEGYQTCHDFFLKYPDKTFTQFDQKALFWGAWNKKLERWYDNRVGFAQLEYPAPLRGLRHVYAHYWEFLDAGQVAFVWIYQLGDEFGQIPQDQPDPDGDDGDSDSHARIFDEAEEVEPEPNDGLGDQEQTNPPKKPVAESKEGFWDMLARMWAQFWGA